MIALNLLSALSCVGVNAHYVTGSRAFTETLRRIVGPRAKLHVKYFNSYMQADFNEVDVLLCDESHRIRESSNSRFMRARDRSDRLQIDELLSAGKVLIFGPDLVYRHGQGWVGQKQYSHDSVVKRSGDDFVRLVKNVYRVLLSRAMKGCYVYFMDKETEDFFRSRMEEDYDE